MTLTGRDTYEEPDRDSPPDLGAPIAPLGTTSELGPSLGPQPATEIPPLPSNADAALAEWIQAIIAAHATRTRDEVIQVVGTQNENIRAVVAEGFETLHDPYGVFVHGVLYGAGGVLVSLVALLLVGLLAMLGLSVIRGGADLSVSALLALVIIAPLVVGAVVAVVVSRRR